MYLSLAIQEIVSKATCESNKDTNKQTMCVDDLLLLSPIPALLRHAPIRTQLQRRPNNRRTYELAVEMASAVEAAQTLLLLCGD